MIKLSFIVPVYNVAPYLRKCVDSLLAQDYDDYEIILVDDGSTDGSGKICDELAEKAYPQSLPSLQGEELRSIESPVDVHRTTKGVRPPIRVIHQENGGLSAARNAGIKCAEGKYLCFVDSDDYWEPNVLGSLMAQVERENLDVLRFNYSNVNETYEEFHPNKDPKRDVDYSESVVDGETFLNERLGPACYAVMFILRRDMILNLKSEEIVPPAGKEIINHKSEIDDCLFTEGIYFEDVDWTPRMLLRAKRVASTPQVVYNYLWRSGSITQPTDSVKRKKVLEDKMRLIRVFQEQSKHLKNPAWFAWMTSSMVVGVLSSIAHFQKAERESYINELKSLHVFPLSAKREKMWTQKMKIIMANFSPLLYCKLISIRK